jgi:hypothetical protein
MAAIAVFTPCSVLPARFRLCEDKPATEVATLRGPSQSPNVSRARAAAQMGSRVAKGRPEGSLRLERPPVPPRVANSSAQRRAEKYR